MNGAPATVEFRRNAVQPIECLKAGWNLIQSQYWLFVGMTAVGMIIATVVPLGILMGPMMCGLYLAVFKTRRGEPIEFGDLFKGFDFFGDSLIATLIHMIPVIVLIIPAYILYFVGVFAMVGLQRGGEPNPGAVLGFFGFFAVFWLTIVVLIFLISVLFTFAYPLIVDRRLSGVDAVKLSIKAVLANFWRLVGLVILTGLMGFVGALFCWVGAFFVLPISFAAIATAYEQVFGLGWYQPNLPPPPPRFA